MFQYCGLAKVAGSNKKPSGPSKSDSLACSARQVMAFVATGFTLLLMTGCNIPNLRGATLGQGSPADFNGKSSAENSAHMGINEFFGDQVLTQLISDGLAQNQELKIRNEEIQVAYNEVTARRGAYLPFVNIGAGGGVGKTSRFTPLGAAEDQLFAPKGRRFNHPITDSGLSANLIWQLDIWGQLRNARDAAMTRYCEAIEQRNYLITKLVAETAENYFELAALDRRQEYLDQTITLQQKSLDTSKDLKAAGRGTELAVQRFLAEVRKNESQRLIVKQRIIEVENRINFLVGRYPQPVDRKAWNFIKLDARVLNVGLPSQLLQNRRDIVVAERELAAAGLDVEVARANFYPKVAITAGVGFESFNPRFLFDPGALFANTAGQLVAPLINKLAIQAEYQSANARQLQAVYNYQRTVLNAFTEVVNNVSKVENYRSSVTIKLEQVKALEEYVGVATDLFQAGRKQDVEYMDVLFAQRDLLEARTVLIETKQQQLTAIVTAYQALGGGLLMDPDSSFYSETSEPLDNPEEAMPIDQPAENALPEPQPDDPANNAPNDAP